MLDGCRTRVARVIGEFHDQQHITVVESAKNVHSLVRVIYNFSNPFDEESTDLLVLDTMEIHTTNLWRLLAM